MNYPLFKNIIWEKSTNSESDFLKISFLDFVLSQKAPHKPIFISLHTTNHSPNNFNF